ncbi:MAG TPA: dockerin type I domain-containing protein [Pseudobacteroides sp.]|uniref:dockerin type I domain-containing protein n=1 Tax=Pseudobacteroides sp. TaxID=1968840 RepID=UPI002F9376A5
MDYYVTFNGQYDIYNFNFILDGIIEDDYDNNESYSADIKVGTEVSGKIQYYFDIDTFKFIPDKDGIYYINKTGNCNISLSHENINLTYYNKNSDIPSTYYNLKKGQEYYLTVTGYYISDYSVKVTGPLYIEDDFGNDKYSRKIIQANKLISGEINYAGDIDQFIIDSESTEEYTFDFSGTAGIKASIHLFDGTLYTNLNDISDGSNSTEYELISGYRYYISIEGTGNSTGKYSLKVRKSNEYSTPIPTPISSSSIIEPSPNLDIRSGLTETGDNFGNTFNEAVDIDVNSIIKGSLENDESDFLKFRVNTTGTYRINYSNSIRLNIVSDDKYFIRNHGDYFWIEKDKTYYIIISGILSSDPGDYQLVIEGIIPDKIGGYAEPFDINVNQNVHGNSWLYDKDCLRFVLPQTGYYFIKSDAYYDFYKGDFNNRIYESGLEKSIKGNKGDVYYFVFEQDKYNEYNFTITFPEEDECANSYSYSPITDITSQITGKSQYPFDHDTYHFNTSEGGIYSIDIKGMEHIDWAIENDSLCRELSQDVRINGQFINAVRIEPNRDYYLRLNPSFGDNYSVKLTKLGEDSMNEKALVNILNVNSSENDTIDFKGDADCYKFTPSSNGEYELVVCGSKGITIDMMDYNYITMEDKATSKLIKIEDDLGVVRIKLTLEEIHQYFFTIYSDPDSASSKYSLMLVDPSIKQDEEKTYKLSGYIRPDMPNANSDVLKGFDIEITGVQQEVNTDENGYFEAKLSASQPTNEIKIRISKKGFLAREITYNDLSSDIVLSTKEIPTEMWAGDVTGDNKQDGVINMMDIVMIARSFNAIETSEGYNPEYDFNRDKVINFNDIIIVARHFNSSSDDY